MLVNKDALYELAAQLDTHDKVEITLEGSENVTLEITDVHYNGMDDVVKVRMEAVHK